MKLPTLRIVALLSTVLLVSAAPQNTEHDNFVIRDVRLFNVERVLEGQDLVVEKGIITHSGVDLVVPEGFREIDGTGHTLLPGLIDAHTHTVSAEVQEQSLALGVTTELDMFANWQLAAGIRDRQTAGLNAHRSDLLSAGTLATSPGGHGTEYGMSIPTIDRPGDAQAFVDARISEGSDYIKIVYDMGRAFGLSMPTISKPTLGALIEAAHERDKLAVVHIGDYQGACDALELGADGIAHMFMEEVDDADIERFVELVSAHWAFVIPTLTVLESVTGKAGGAELENDERIRPYVSPSWRENLKTSFPNSRDLSKAFAASMKTVKALRDEGIRILAGSDAPNPGTAHGASIHRELELLVQAGLTPTEALAAATSWPAQSFDLGDRGTIGVGMRADLLLVKGDPTKDITATRNIVSVWKRGVLMDREAVRARFEAGVVSTKTATNGIGDGRVSDFEGGDLRSNFGSGWSVSTDSLMGGKSSAELEVVDGGANGTSRSMRVFGEVVAGNQPWAGAMFSPGDRPMSPVDLSSMSSVSFWAKGKPGTYYPMMFLKSRGFMPAVQSVQVTKEWQEFTIAVSDFDGADASDLTGFYFGAGDPGPLEFWLDEIRFMQP